MYHAQMVLKRIEQAGLSPYRVAKGTGISESLFSKWKKSPDTFITSQNLILIADYLDCSVDYLLGRDKDANKPAPDFGDGLDETDLEIMKQVKWMNPEQKATFLAFLRTTVAKNQNTPVSVPGSIVEKAPQ